METIESIILNYIKSQHSIQQNSKKKLNISNLEHIVRTKLGEHIYSKQNGYKEFVRIIRRFENEGLIQPIKTNFKTNEKRPPLRLMWWIEPKYNKNRWSDSTIFRLSTKLQLDFYLENKKYQVNEELEKIECIYLFLTSSLGYQTVGREERSIMLFNNAKSITDVEKEKYLSTSEGKELLRRLKLTEHDLAFEVRKEPFIYWENPDVAKENENEVLIVEGLATYYTVKSLIQEDRFLKLGPIPKYVVWGAGNRIEGTLPYFHEIVKDASTLEIRYVGDIDYAGLSIFVRLKNKFPDWKLSLSIPFYRFLTERCRDFAQYIPTDQNRNDAVLNAIVQELYGHDEIISIIRDLWLNGERIPLEAINLENLAANGWLK